MTKKAKPVEGGTVRFVRKKPTKSEKTSPRGQRRKAYRGQGRA